MQALTQAIEVTLDTRRTGAQLVARDEYTVLLYHNEFLTQEVLELVLEQFPGTEIAVQRSDASRSGYVVQFTLLERRSVWLSSTCMHVLLTVLCILTGGVMGRVDCLLSPGG